MSRKSDFRCLECGVSTPKWAGRCSGCQAWNTLVEEVVAPGWPSSQLADQPEPLDEIDVAIWAPRSTGVAEVDRVTGGGLVPASVTLIGGEPGIGKSTLLLQMAARRPGSSPVLYATGEESKQQVRQRAERLGLVRSSVSLVAEASLPAILGHIDTLKPELVVIDSVQTMFDPDLGSPPGSVGQVRHVSARLVRLAKETGVAVVLVGHVTKDGALAGPRVLEHVVDTVLEFSGDRHQGLRMLRAVKHRFGSTGELGLFEMGEQGLVELPDASTTFLADRPGGVSGSVVAATIEGSRPLMVEVQALVSRGRREGVPGPRISPGLDGSRLALVLAVIEQRLGLSLSGADVYAAAIGGVKVREPGLDLPLALAVVSSVCEVTLPADLVAVGEVGLSGELRQVGRMDRRLAEASRLGFRGAIVPFATPDLPVGLTLHRAASLVDAVALTGMGADRSRRAS